MTIAHLHKVDLEAVCVDPERSGAFSFIFGVGSGGLTPFEHRLHEAGIGVPFDLSLGSHDMQAYFGHLLAPLAKELGIGVMPDTVQLRLTLRSAETADHREVVRAMARAVGQQGCGGGCGCGCG